MYIMIIIYLSTFSNRHLKSHLKSGFLDLVCTDDVSEAVTLEERDESLAAEEVCRAAPRVVDEALVLLQVLDGLRRQHLQADTTTHAPQNQLSSYHPGLAQWLEHWARIHKTS